MMRKVRRFLLYLMIFSLGLMAVGSAAAAPPQQNDLQGFMPDLRDLTPNSNIVPEYSKYSWTQYSFDIEKSKGLLDINAILNVFPNIVFIPLVLLTKFTTFLLVSCYKLNIYEIMPDAINSLVMAVKDGITEGLYQIVIALAGVFGIYKTYKGSKTSGFKITLSTIAVLGLSVWFFNNPSLFATNLNKGTEVISSQVLYQVSRVAGTENGYRITSADDSVVLMGNLFWNMAVEKPYELIQYGRMNQNDSQEFLKLEVGSKERQNLANNYAKDNIFFRGACIAQRFALAFVMLLFGLVYNICMLLIAGMVAYNHFGSLFWICFAGVFFLAALYPSNGLRVLADWAIKTFGFLLKRVIITIALSIYFAISLFVWTLAGRYGYLSVLVFNIILLIYAILNHEEVYRLLMKLFTADDPTVNRGMQKESLGSKVSRAVVTAYAGQRLYSGLKNRIEHNKRKDFEKKNSDKATEVLTERYSREKQQSRKASEHKLMEKYTKEKQEAEKRAAQTGNKPEYSRFVMQADSRKKQQLPMWSEKQIQENLEESDFVKGVDERKGNGYTLFSDDQVKSTLNHMYKLKLEGNDPNRLLYTDVKNKTGEQIREDQKRKEEKIKATQKRLDEDRSRNNEIIEDEIEAYPDENFRLKSFSKSYARKGLKALGGSVKEQVERMNGVDTGRKAESEVNRAPAAGSKTRVINLNDKTVEKVNVTTQNEAETNENIKNVSATTNQKETKKAQLNVSNSEETGKNVEANKIEKLTTTSTQKHEAVNELSTSNSQIVNKNVEDNKLEKLTTTSMEKHETEAHLNISNTETINKNVEENKVENLATTQRNRVNNEKTVATEDVENIKNINTKQVNNLEENRTVNEIKETNVSENRRVVENKQVNTTEEHNTVENNRTVRSQVKTTDMLEQIEPTIETGQASDIKFSEVMMASQLLNSRKKNNEGQKQADAMKEAIRKLKEQGDDDEYIG